MHWPKRESTKTVIVGAGASRQLGASLFATPTRTRMKFAATPRCRLAQK